MVIILKIIFIDIILMKMSTSGNVAFLRCEKYVGCKRNVEFHLLFLKLKIPHVFSKDGLLMDEV